LNISAIYHQNRSLQFRAIPFQSWAVYFETQCRFSGLLSLFLTIRVYTHLFCSCCPPNVWNLAKLSENSNL